MNLLAVDPNPLESFVICVVMLGLLTMFAWSAKSDFSGHFIGFDFSWVRRLLRRDGKTDEGI